MRCTQLNSQSPSHRHTTNSAPVTLAQRDNIRLSSSHRFRFYAGQHQQLRALLLFGITLSILLLIIITSTTPLWAQQVATENEQRVEEQTGLTPAIGQCGDDLPVLEWLGEGPATHTLTTEFETFIVKRRPFNFYMESGQQISSGQTIYQAKNNERVWRCRGNCQLPAVYHSVYPLGSFAPGTIINMVVIDDDGREQNNDQRRNWWAHEDPLVPYQIIEEQEMVEYLSFEIPEAGNWYYYANDSVGITATCAEPIPPTSTPTPPRIESPTATPSPTNTPTPSLRTTPLSTETPASTSTPTATGTATATNPPTVTATASPQKNTATATATATETATAKPPITRTPPVFMTMTVTPTLTTRPPTALQLVSLQANTVDRALRIRWETAFELNVHGFHLWRSTTGSRANATPLTPTLIYSQGTASTGMVYEFIDNTVDYGTSYTYWLEQVEVGGRQEDVGQTASYLVHAIYLPLIER